MKEGLQLLDVFKKVHPKLPIMSSFDHVVPNHHSLMGSVGFEQTCDRIKGSVEDGWGGKGDENSCTGDNEELCDLSISKEGSCMKRSSLLRVLRDRDTARE